METSTLTQPNKQARLEARIAPEIHLLLKRAAEIQGRTLTDFVIEAAQKAAYRAIEDSQMIRLCVEDQRTLAESILNAPEPTPALKRAFKRHHELIVSIP